jgi:hypothetical protein
LLKKRAYLRAPRRGWGSVGYVVDEPANKLLYFLLRASIDDLSAMAPIRSTQIDVPAPAPVRSTEYRSGALSPALRH